MDSKDTIIKYLRGHLNHQEKLDFFEALDQDEELRERFYKEKNWWVKAGVKPVLSAEERQSDFNAIWNEVSPKTKRLRISNMLKYAAMIILTLCIGGLVGYITNEQVHSNTHAANQVYSFSSGERSVSEVKLPDGSVVRLNSNSKITYQKDVQSNERLLTLKGEAFFEVYHDEESPFVVDFNELKIVDLGTSFNIKAYDCFNAIETSLVEGAIQVNVDGNKVVDMKPNQKALFNRSNSEVKIMAFDGAQELAWTNNRFIFQGASLYTISSELSLWYGVDIKWETTAQREDSFHFNIDRSTSLESIMKMLKISSNIDYKLVRKEGKLSEIIIK
ncbi:FecR family protein [Carboxylicivirga sp. N1Y90]|uniref:FecR family protein n=1 Tax=Carboxylicivirga fragile TaxID=3417571 RepID=UPI003D324CAD|nr:FecR family protein [Marinilabiliaceae bacterium N1Y90]